VNKKDLIPVSIELLYDGMVVPQDIYDADARLLLIRRGNTLNMSQVKAIRRYNKDRDTIQVSLETHNLMTKRKPILKKSANEVNAYQVKLEKETGYSEIKGGMQSVINNTEQDKTPPRDKIDMLSHDLSERVEKTKPDVILALINALAPVDEYLQRHCVNVSLLNGLIGKWLGLPKETVDMLIQVGLVHDYGKISIPSQILDAPRKLSSAEFEVIKMHPVYAYEMLSEFPDTIRYGVRGHHEKYGGRGYPDALVGDKIPIMAQVTAVSDIYDAMVSQRAYKKPRNPFSIIAWINELSGRELEKSIVDSFTTNMPKEMINKTAMLSNGEIGVIHELDYEDLEHPYIRVGGKVIKSNENLYCIQMYLEEGGTKDGK
jgi:HD-GYP domain-containing protein (c-di-GMP phosphodiesterase class II)